MERSVFYALPGRLGLFLAGFMLCTILVNSSLYAQNSVGIGTAAPNPNAVLDLNSPTNSQGFLVPRLRTAERNGIPASSPADDGLLVYDIEQKNFFYWHDGGWHALTTDVGVPGFQQLSLANNTLTLDNGGSVDLTPYLDNTDGQQLNFDSGTGILTISGGNMVDLSSLAGGSSFSGSFNDLSDVPAQLDIDGSDDVNNGDNISVLTNDAGYITSPDDADPDPTNEEITAMQLSGNVLEITEAGSVKTVDLTALASGGFSGSFNDLTDLPAQLDVNDLDDVTTGDNISVLTNDAGYITSPDDADPDPTNEEITAMQLSGNVLEITEAGSVKTVDLTALASGGFSGSFNDLTDLPAQLDVNDLDDVTTGDNISVLTNDAGYITSPDDADSNPTNEAISSVTLIGTVLSIFENGALAGSANLSLLPFSSFSGDFGDLSNVPANLDIDDTDDLVAGDNISMLTNDAGYITNPDDADANPDNEAITDVTLNVNTLEVYENGALAGSADLSGYLDNTDAQTLNFNSGTNQLSISNGNTVDLSTLAAVIATDDQSLTQFNLTGTYNEQLNITLEDDPGGSKQVNLHNLGFLAGSDLTGTLGNASLKDGSVDSNAIQDGSILSGDIQDNTITANDIANNAIGTSEITDGAVTNAKISDLDPNKLNQQGAGSGQVLKWNGTEWAPADDDSGSGGVPGTFTRYYSVDPSDFTEVYEDNTDLDKNQMIIFSGENEFVTVREANSTLMLVAPVHLPDGAEVTDVTIYYWDSDPQDLTVDFYRKPFAGTNESVLASSWVSSVNTSGIQSVSIASFTNPVIDNSLYTYRIVAELDYGGGSVSDPSDADVRIYGIRFTYTEPGNLISGPGNYQTSYVSDTAPPGGDLYVGFLWIDTGSDRVRVWDGSSWQTVANTD